LEADRRIYCARSVYASSRITAIDSDRPSLRY
jgi:hypothetical protein